MCNLTFRWLLKLVVLLSFSTTAYASEPPTSHAQLPVNQSEVTSDLPQHEEEEEVASGPEGQDRLQLALLNLTASSFAARKQAIELLGKVKDERASELLQALMSRKAVYEKSSKDIFIKTDEGYKALLSQQIIDATGLKFSKIRTNNSLRKLARIVLSGQQLFSSDQSVRVAAADNLINSPDTALMPVLEEAMAQDDNSKSAQRAIEMAHSMVVLTSSQDDAALQLAAQRLAKANKHQVLGKLKSLDTSQFSADTQEAIAESIASIETRKELFGFSENLFFGLSAASILLLAALGLAITFGVMRVINMAHGEMIMLGAYATYTVQQLMPGAIEYSIMVAIPVAFMVSAIAGIILERTVIQHLYGRPLETLLATFGVSLILQQAVRSVYGPLNQSVMTPQWLAGAWEINGFLSLTYNRLAIIIFSVLVLIGVIMFMKRTRFGLEMRAVTQNRPMAANMGIRTKRVDMMAFGLGSGIAGIAGVGLSQLTNVGPNLGQAYIIDSFMVVVFGGVGSFLGTFSGAVSLGVANKAIEPVVGAVLAKILILVAIIIFIQRRPRGLFALKGRGAEDL